MNYNEYNNQLKLSDDLYEKTLAGVKSGISKHNQVRKKRKTVLFSAAACFVIFACSVSAVKHLSKNSPFDVLESTIKTPTENSNKDNSIIFNTEETKYPHKIIINNKIYSQYYFGDEKGDKNNNIELKQSEIGELICEIDYFNLTDDLTDFAPMSIEEAKDNKFYKAKVFTYAKAKSDNLIIVQAENDYYLFYLNGLTTDYTIKDLLNIYTADGANKIIGIEVWQNELYDYTIELPEAEDITGQDIRPLLRGTIKDREVIKSITDILRNNNKEHSGNPGADLSDYEKGLTNVPPLMSDTGEYELQFIFADGQELNLDKISLDISLQKDFFYFNICHKENFI
ncbi:MAG: hypothetical protein K2L36_02710, partial [Eubacterium sp.]|nr:hypothetical protein [Eubacterium sp.]